MEGIAKSDASATCSYLAGEVERLAQTAQSEQALPSYAAPILVGVGPGAALAQAIYAQHPKSFAALATWGACGQIALPVPLCAADDFAPSYDRARKLVTVSLPHALPGPHLAVASSCSATALPQRSEWRLKLQALLRDQQPTLPDTGALPVIEIRAKKQLPAMPLVVFLSGDGGWATIDKRLGEYLAEEGVDVVGFDTLRFCWKEKTPADMAQAISQIMAKYRVLWGHQKVVLMGFSLGAEHIPIFFPLLSRDLQVTIPLVVLLSPGKSTDFEVHIGDWLGLPSSEPQYPVAPAIDKLTEIKVACIHGREDTDDSACVGITLPGVIRKELPGGHHFDGAYKSVAALVSALLRGWALTDR
ncbi:MAG: hypothetical protein EBZ48_15375 [Proteobacteria bacterium]|nr:hypothetical protein [Pseudomonadota bacterium]